MFVMFGTEVLSLKIQKRSFGKHILVVKLKDPSMRSNGLIDQVLLSLQEWVLSRLLAK